MSDAKQGDVDAWVQAWLIDESWIILRGDWSIDFESMASDQPSFEELGLTSPLLVEEDTVKGLLETGRPCGIELIPEGECEIALRWSAIDSGAWYSVDYRRSNRMKSESDLYCGTRAVLGTHELETEDGVVHRRIRPSERMVEAVVGGPGPQDIESSGFGRVQLLPEGAIAIGAFGQQSPEGFCLVAAMQSDGDVYFWLIPKPEDLGRGLTK